MLCIFDEIHIIKFSLKILATQQLQNIPLCFLINVFIDLNSTFGPAIYFKLICSVRSRVFLFISYTGIPMLHYDLLKIFRSPTELYCGFAEKQVTIHRLFYKLHLSKIDLASQVPEISSSEINVFITCMISIFRIPSIYM